MCVGHVYVCMHTCVQGLAQASKLFLFIRTGKVIVESLHKHAIMMYCCNVHTENNVSRDSLIYNICTLHVL